jgi:hypothetical protein
MVAMETVTGEQVVQAARKYLGAPYKLHGRDKSGLDCVGLAACLAEEFGPSLEIPKYSLHFEGPLVFLKSQNFREVTTPGVGDLWLIVDDKSRGRGLMLVTQTGGLFSVLGVSRTIQCGVNGKPLVEVGFDLDDLMMFSMGMLRRYSRFFRFPFVA